MARRIELALDRKLEAFESPWRVPARVYKIIVDGGHVGRVSLRFGNTEDIRLHAGHIGYRVAEEHQGHGYALAASRLALPILWKHDLETVWITCNPDNAPSIRTIEKLGAIYVDTVKLPRGSRYWKRGDRFKRRYRIDR